MLHLKFLTDNFHTKSALGSVSEYVRKRVRHHSNAHWKDGVLVAPSDDYIRTQFNVVRSLRGQPGEPLAIEGNVNITRHVCRARDNGRRHSIHCEEMNAMSSSKTMTSLDLNDDNLCQYNKQSKTDAKLHFAAMNLEEFLGATSIILSLFSISLFLLFF